MFGSVLNTPMDCVFNITDIYGIKLLTRLCKGLRHLKEHKFIHTIMYVINRFYSCSEKSKLTFSFSFRYPNIVTFGNNFHEETFLKIDSNFLNLDEASLIKLFLY